MAMDVPAGDVAHLGVLRQQVELLLGVAQVLHVHVTDPGFERRVMREQQGGACRPDPQLAFEPR
jgi:hypothetical protein